MQSYPKAKVPIRCTSYGWKRGSGHHCPQVDLLPCFDLNLRLRFDKQWTGRQMKANIPLIQRPFLCLLMIQPAISMHGISLPSYMCLLLGQKLINPKNKNKVVFGFKK
jgi:hypothetical protein